MGFFIANLAVSFFIFLFSLYQWAKDDFILLRKNVSLEQVFNYSFTNVWVMLLFSRIFYVFYHPSLKYINPLIFLIFIYFPGLSLTGGVIGALIFLFFITRKKSIPRGRLYDIFALSFLPAIISYDVLSQILTLIFVKKISIVLLIIAVVFLIISIICSLLFKKDKTKDGVIANSIIGLFSLISITQLVFFAGNKKSLLFDKDVIVLVILFLFSIVLFVRQKMVRRKK